MATYDITTTTITPSSLRPGDVLNCPYTGSIKDVSLPVGTYRLECYGGGTRHADAAKDGYGGYTVGTLELDSLTTLYCVCGGAGQVASDWRDTSPGGYNGGGTGHGAGGLVNNRTAVSGAGATHIAKRTGLLSALSDYRSDIIMVAGGAGSDVYLATSAQKEYTDNRGAGGGSSGKNGNRFQEVDTGGSWSLCVAAQGGSQSAGGAGGIAQYASGETVRSGGAGSFGQGGNSAADYTMYWLTSVWFGGGGGGGGYYGGGGGATSFYITTTASKTKQCSVSGAGGSGYIASALTNAETVEGSANLAYPSDDDGYIRITVLTMPTPTEQAYIKVGGAWQTGKLYRKQNGVWVAVDDLRDIETAEKTFVKG